MSPHFNFLLLLGDRYGYRPLPDRLSVSDFESLVQAVEAADGTSGALMRAWYSLEANVLPPSYLLHTLDEGNRSAFWREAQPTLGPALRKAAFSLHAEGRLSVAVERLICLSVTEQEVLYGMLADPANASDSACFARSIRGWTPTGAASHKFLDVLKGPDGALHADAEAAKLRTELRSQVRSFLREDKFWAHEARWLEDGTGISTAHIERLCQQVDAFLDQRLQLEMRALATVEAAQLEALSHLAFARERAALFVGREAEIARIVAHARTGAGALVVKATSGSGKSSLLAAAWAALGPECELVLRFCGLTRSASSAAPLALSIIGELEALACGSAGAQDASKADDSADASEDALRAKATAALLSAVAAVSPRPLVLVLDALDQLLEFESGGERSLALLGWLPSPLPPGVRVVTSILERPGAAEAQARAAGGEGDASTTDQPPSDAEQLVARLGGVEPKGVAVGEAIVPLGLLAPSELPRMIDLLLANRRRSLQPPQRKALVESALALPNPMFVQLLTEGACRWPASLDPPPALPTSLADACASVLVRLERFHGLPLLKCALGAIEVAAGGLSEPELLDVLSAEEGLMADVLQYHQPEPRKFPPIVWLRLRADLENALAECASAHGGGGGGGSELERGGGPTTLRLFHRQLREAAARRYLGSAEARASRARVIVAAVSERLDSTGSRDFRQLRLAHPQGAQQEPGAVDQWATQRALVGVSRQVQNLIAALLDVRAWAQMDAWLTDIEVVDAVLRSVQLGHAFYARTVFAALALALSEPTREGEEAAGALRLPRLCAFVLICRPPQLGGIQPFFVLPWEPLPPGSAFQATRARGTKCLHVNAQMQWMCFDKPFRDLTGARVLQPHRWRLATIPHTVIHRPQGAAARPGGAQPFGQKPAQPSRPGLQSDEEPPLPPVVRQLIRLRTLQSAAMRVPVNNPLIYRAL
jgi:hypothetical protein